MKCFSFKRHNHSDINTSKEGLLVIAACVLMTKILLAIFVLTCITTDNHECTDDYAVLMIRVENRPDIYGKFIDFPFDNLW